jgi:aryl-alcohol dehydrogenase-like predicted oxidoreductase
MKKSAAECLQFVFSEQGVTSAVLGTINEKHLRENVAGLVGRVA